MSRVSEIFERGPEEVVHWFQNQSSGATRNDLETKELADVCWTRASTLARIRRDEARRWARAALVGYDLLSKLGAPLVAESAQENAEALRAWDLLTEKAPAA